MTIRTTALAFTLAVFGASMVSGQGTEVAFGGLQHDASLDVEISADQLQISQADGSATFTGDVLIGQGEMRISAAKVEVFYAAGDGEATGRISKLLATGGVTIVNGTEAAESRQAEYSIDDSSIIMTGNVILTQGKNALSAERMVIDLKSGNATLVGRVRTVLQSGDGQ